MQERLCLTGTGCLMAEPTDAAPSDLHGWLETRWGMDETYVRILGLHDKQYEIGSKSSFSAELLFTQTRRPLRSRLRFVRLKHESDVTARDVALVREVLTERFGRPARNGTSDGLFWRFPTTTVSLTQVVGRDGVIAIDFQPTSTFLELAHAF